MGLWQIITVTVAGNAGMGIEYIVALLLALGSLVFMAKSFKLGAVLLFFTTGITTLIFINYGLNYTPVIAIFFISLVLMVFTIYASSRTAQEGGAFI